LIAIVIRLDFIKWTLSSFQPLQKPKQNLQDAENDYRSSKSSFQVPAGRQALQSASTKFDANIRNLYEQEADHPAEVVTRQKSVKDERLSLEGSAKTESGILGSGQSLPNSLLAVMGPAFDFNFGRFRVYANSQAARTVRALNSRALARGSSIMFGAGEYQPQKEEGRRIITHELAHVVQQQHSQPQLMFQKKVNSSAPFYQEAIDELAKAKGGWTQAANL
jgi:hypothetical protein